MRPTRLRISLQPLPRKRFSLAEPGVEKGRASLVGERFQRSVLEELRASEPLPLPIEGGLSLRLARGDLIRAVDPRDWPEGRPLPWPAPVEVRVGVRDPGGRPVPCRGRLVAHPSDDESLAEATASEGEVVLRTFETGRLWVILRPEDPELPARCLPVDVPSFPGRSIVLPAQRLARGEGAPSLQVQLPDGARAAGAIVHLRHGKRRWRDRLDRAGRLGPERLPRLEAGSWIEVRDGGRMIQPPPSERLHPLRHALPEGLRGPLRLQWPEGRLHITFADQGGSPLSEGTVLVERRAHDDPRRGRLEIRGLPLGPHTIVVTAPGRVAHRYRVVLESEQPHKLPVRLAPRS